ncbi:hypothetical protein [Dokdonella sp.]|uniref:hypothetical protein n=1 Tax=Dokdonella sp. TaxID=2291710 RepID=UPI0025C17F12|nr:hypothetical protein [Dokdonella sp.]MBX3688771.1 hypothetical protein [Dokdonella sp.]
MFSPLVWMLCIAVGLVLLAASVLRIPEGQIVALRRIGGHERHIGPGMHLMLPLLERVARKISLAGTTLRIDDLERDGSALQATIYFQVLDPERADRLLDDTGSVLRARTRELVAASEFPASTQERAGWLKRGLNERLRECGLIVARVDLS